MRREDAREHVKLKRVRTFESDVLISDTCISIKPFEDTRCKHKKTSRFSDTVENERCFCWVDFSARLLGVEAAVEPASGVNPPPEHSPVASVRHDENGIPQEATDRRQ